MTTTPPKSRRRFLSFSLKGLLFLVLLFAVAFGWARHIALEQGIAVAELEKLGCSILRIADGPLTPVERLRMLFGEEHPRNVTQLLTGTMLEDAGMAYLSGLPHLEYLSLNGTQVTDAGMDYLNGLKDLEYLWLNGTQVTDAGLKHLRGLTNLSQLALENTKVTDAGLAHLAGLIWLKYLDLVETQVTNAGVAELQKALPNCRIDR